LATSFRRFNRLVLMCDSGAAAKEILY